MLREPRNPVNPGHMTVHLLDVSSRYHEDYISHKPPTSFSTFSTTFELFTAIIGNNVYNSFTYDVNFMLN